MPSQGGKRKRDPDNYKFFPGRGKFDEVCCPVVLARPREGGSQETGLETDRNMNSSLHFASVVAAQGRVKRFTNLDFAEAVPAQRTGNNV